MRRTKIVGTLGPASCTPEVIAALIRAGLDVARVNFSHGDHRDHASLIRIVREEARKQERAVGILQDLQGPKIRTGRFTDGKVELKEGNEFTITTRDVPGDVRVVSTTYKSLPRDVKPGVAILLDDGYLQLEVIEVVTDRARARWWLARKGLCDEPAPLRRRPAPPEQMRLPFGPPPRGSPRPSG